MVRPALSERPGWRRILLASGGRWLGAGLDLVFPPQCAVCRGALETSAAGMFCTPCRTELVGALGCPRCAASSAVAGDDGCPHCRHERQHFDGVARLGPYTGQLRTAVLAVKRPQQRSLAIALGDLLADARRAQLANWAVDAVVPLPMHWSRRLWRGANSPETIAERLARSLGVPLAGHLLKRRRRTAPQASLSPQRRVRNVRGAFRAHQHVDLPGARLLLVDDIMTTGATVNEASKVLRQAGAAAVVVAVLARAEGLG